MDSTVRRMIIGIALVGATAVLLGAFGSHGLKAIIDERLLSTWKTGVQYQFYHVALLSLIMWMYYISPTRVLRIAYRLTIAGILCFSGSLYLLALRQPLGIDSWTWLGPVTPIGGLLLVASWLLLGYGVLRRA